MSTTTTNLGLFKYDTSTDAQLAFNINQALNGNWDILDKSTLNGDIITLGSSGTQALTNNRVHKITCNGNTTFSLPTPDNTSFNQILVLLYMPTAYSINLGTTAYFNGSTPDMSNTGYYTIIYEYDPIRSTWTVGVLPKDTDGTAPVEYPFIRPNISAYGTMGGNSFACQVHHNNDFAGFEGWKCFDGNTTSTSTDYWDTRTSSYTDGMPAWITWYNPQPLKITQVTIIQARGDLSPASGNIQASNDNSNWTILKNWTNSNVTTGASWDISLSDNSNFYNYYRFNIASANGSAMMTMIREITMIATYQG